MFRALAISRHHSCALVVLAAAAVSLPACGSGEPGADAETDQVGSIGLELELAPDVTLRTLQYEITGNGFQKSGSIDVSKSRRVRSVIGGIPAGDGYTIALSGEDAEGLGIACAGSAPFNVAARHTTKTAIDLLCQLPGGKGSVDIEVTQNVCPRIDSISAEPAETTVGNSLALGSEVTDLDQKPSPVAFVWTASGGSLSNADTASPTFTCTETGEATVTLSVTDTKCDDEQTITLTCSPPLGEIPLVRVNEVESSGGIPGDWAELYNAGATSVDLSGWTFRDNDDTHISTIPAGTIIAPGGFYVIEESALGFGLGGGDSARLYDDQGTLVDTHTWTSHAPTTYGRCPDGTGTFGVSTAVTKGAPNDCSVAITITEVESNGGTPGDWVELYNAGPSPADLSGFVFRDSDDTHAYSLPAGTVVAAGAYFVLEEAAFGFGLGGADSARLFDPSGEVVDSHAWTAHASTSYGRCPNPAGDFTTTTSTTKGTLNACPATGPEVFAWPGEDAVTTADGTSVFGGNLSGLIYEPAAAIAPAALWAVRNGPGTLYRLEFDGSIWTPASGEWAAGKTLRYTDGTGNPDSESVTRGDFATSSIYVATERNNDASTVSRLSVLRFDLSHSGTTLVATHDFNLTADLPSVGANLGLEAITFVPDATLVAAGMRDETTAAVYDPTRYSNHEGGVFFVGVEGTGSIHAYVFDHVAISFVRLATFASGQTGTMGIEFDRETGYLWALCDDTCEGRTNVLGVDTDASSPTFGRFTVLRTFARPSTLPNLNNEGIAIASEATCSAGFKDFFWADDGETAGHSIRVDSIPCGRFF
jgi:hypothetical protein